MKCASCPTGLLSRNKKPDALGRIIEKCDACAYRRTISGDELVVAPLSGSLAQARAHVAPPPTSAVVAARALPPAVPGKPCPHCGGKAPYPRPCIKCHTKNALPHKRRCADCFTASSALPSRFCVECGEKYERQTGDPPSAAYRCPKHRKEKSA